MNDVGSIAWTYAASLPTGYVDAARAGSEAGSCSGSHWPIAWPRRSGVGARLPADVGATCRWATGGSTAAAVLVGSAEGSKVSTASSPAATPIHRWRGRESNCRQCGSRPAKGVFPRSSRVDRPATNG
jgi:hypothetical protein